MGTIFTSNLAGHHRGETVKVVILVINFVGETILMGNLLVIVSLKSFNKLPYLYRGTVMWCPLSEEGLDLIC